MFASARPSMFGLCVAVALAACAPPMEAKSTPKAPVTKAAAATADKPIALPAGAAQNVEEMRARLAVSMPNVELEDIKPSPIAGLYEVRKGYTFGYVSADGRHLITGDLTDLTTGKEVTEVSRREARKGAIAKVGDQVIPFNAPKLDPDKVVTVFTDIDCGYCRKLHSQIAQYNAQGISVHYLFFPRSGVGSPSFATAEAVWCAADRKAALTAAKNGGTVPAAPASCKAPIEAQYNLGADLGLRGTPMMILANGEVVNGYMPPEALAARLAQQGMPAAEGAP